jgi:outer membrane autotransporter protein
VVCRVFGPQSTLLQYAATEKPSRPEYKAFAAIRPETGAFRPQRFRAWMTAFGGSQSLRGDLVIGSVDSSNRTFGAAGGFDYQLGPDTLVGFAAAGTWSSFSVPGRATTGTLDAAHVGVYGIQRWGAAYLAGTLSFSHFNNNTMRTIAGLGPTETALAQFGSDQFGGRLQAGYKFAFDRFAVTPFAAVQYLNLWQHAYSEASFTTAGAPGILGLNVQARSISSLPTFLGAQVDTRIAFPNGAIWVPFVRASWVHELMPDRNISAALGILPTGTFIVDGPRSFTDAARVEAGSSFYVTRNVAFFASFVGEYSSHTSSSAGNGGIKATW